MIKVCINPHCEELAHNYNIDETRCRNCDFILVKITEETYLKKYINNFFQIDYQSGERVKPNELGYNLQLKLKL
jgi:hypothetical protein